MLYLWLLFGILILGLALAIWLKKVPHGWVELKTGLVLQFLPPLDKYPVLKLRQSIEDFVAKKLPKIKRSLPVKSVTDRDIPTRHGSINGRIYNNHSEKPSHMMVLIHGGGWCIGSVNTYEEISRRLVRETGLPLISLEYSLAPESKFPIAHEECVDAVSWIAQNTASLVDAAIPLILVGDSAGGNLILSTLYESVPEVRQKIDKIIPVYPAADSRKTTYQSAKDYARGYYLTQKSMDQFTEGLLETREQKEDVRLSPIEYPVFSGFPDTFVITAEFDPIRDQGEAYAAKLKREGAPVILKRYKGTIHAFFGLKDFGNQGLNAIKDINLFIQGQKVQDTTI